MTQYLYGNLSNPFQVTASRAPDNVLTVYYYDEFERSPCRNRRAGLYCDT